MLTAWGQLHLKPIFSLTATPHPLPASQPCGNAGNMQCMVHDEGFEPPTSSM